MSLLLLMMVLLSGVGSVVTEKLTASFDSARLLRSGLLVISIAVPTLVLAPEFAVFVGGLAAYGIGLGAWLAKVFLDPRSARIALARIPRMARSALAHSGPEKPPYATVTPAAEGSWHAELVKVRRLERRSVALGRALDAQPEPGSAEVPVRRRPGARADSCAAGPAAAKAPPAWRAPPEPRSR